MDRCATLKLRGVLAAVMIGAIPSVAQTSPDREIAYVWPSVDSTQIRLHDLRRRTHKPVFKLNKRIVSLADRIGHRLDWNSRGTELAFDSGHEYRRSLNIRDIYTIAPQQKKVRRITNAPHPIDYRRLPKGNVIVDISHTFSAELSVFIQGARQAIEFTSRGPNAVRVTFRGVADFGKGVRQYVRVLNHASGTQNPCWFDLGIFADVVPGKTVYAGRLRSLLNDHTCPRAYYPSWHSNGRKITFVGATADTSIADHHAYTTPNRPNIRLSGGSGQITRVYEDTDRVRHRLFAVYMSPAGGPIRHEMLMFDYHGGITDTQVYFKDISKPDRRTNISGLLPCGDNRSRCRTLSLDFLLGGSRIVVARYEEADFATGGPDYAVLYEYNFRSRRLNRIIQFENEAIGEISVSSDGKTIAFTRSASLDPDAFINGHGERLLCPCDVWSVDKDGTRLRRIRANARTPAWRPGA